MVDFSLDDTVFKFSSGTDYNWDLSDIIIPNKVIIITTNTRIFKRGDGTHRYSELPVIATIDDAMAGMENLELVNSLVYLPDSDEGRLIVIDNGLYDSNDVSLSDILSRLNSLANRNILQSTNIVTINQKIGMVDLTVDNSDDGKLAAITDGKISPGPSFDDLVLVSSVSSPLHILNYGIYLDRALTEVAEFLSPSMMYYVKVDACHDTVDTDDLLYELTSDGQLNILVTHIGRGLFTIMLPSGGSDLMVTFVLNVSHEMELTSRSITIQYEVGP